MNIRPERPEDAAAIGAITAAAFEGMEHSSGTEPRIVEALRRANALTISLVAVDAGGVPIGHIAFSPVRLDGQEGRWFALGPVSVRPDLQRRRIGSALIEEGLARLAELGAQGCILLGEPAYYGRFGFVTDAALTYFRHPNPYLQRLAFGGEGPRGDVAFHPAFDVP